MKGRLVYLEDEELAELERDLYELRCYLKRDKMQIASEKVLVREKKLQACLKGEADPTKEMIMAIYVDLKCFVENHFSESKISEEYMVKFKGYLGE